MARPRFEKGKKRSSSTSFGKKSDAEKAFKRGKKSRPGDSDKPDSKPPRSYRSENTESNFSRPKRTGFSSSPPRRSSSFRKDSQGEGGDASGRPGARRSFSESSRSRPFKKNYTTGGRKGFGGSSDKGQRPNRPFSKESPGGERKFGEHTGKRSYGEKPFKKNFTRGEYKRPSDSENRSDKPFSKEFRGGERKYGEQSGKRSYSDKPFKKNFSRGEFRKADSENQSDKPFSKESGGRKYGEQPDKRPYTDKPFKKNFNRDDSGESGKPSDRRSPGRPFKESFIKSRVAKKEEFVKPSSTPEKPQDGLIRLNKFIANSGIGSRREADELIQKGLISINGETITQLGTKVKPGDVVRYDDKVLKAEKPVYILLNKPKGFITTTEDPQERNTVMGLVAGACKERIYPVGRLDRNTTGILLLTNDGDLADKLTHPSYQAKKVYKVELDRPLTKNDFQQIVDGVSLEEGVARVDDLAIISDDKKTVGLEIHIGWNRIVRRIFESLGYNVERLDRSVYAGLDKKDLSRGQWRFLKPEEVIRLKHFK
jgi:23S rRNA pseudouridine2605 synthase